MSTNETVVSKSESTEGPIETKNPHVEAAQARLRELRLMRDQIPRFLIPESPKAALRLNSAASVPPEFVELTVVAVANQKALARGESISPAEIRDLMRYAEAYSPLADELEAQAQFVRFSVNAARNAAGQRSADDLRAGAAPGETPPERRSRAVRGGHAPRPRACAQAVARGGGEEGSREGGSGHGARGQGGRQSPEADRGVTAARP